MGYYSLIFIYAIVLSACNNNVGSSSAEELPVTVDSNITLPYDSISFGTDTDDHNKGNLPTNTLDTAVPNSRNEQ